MEYEYEYGYGKLEDKLITLLRSGNPDFEAAEELIRQGANLNALGKNKDENILFEILMGYGQCKCDDSYNKQNLGQNMCSIIRLFLEHGFDVNKFDGCFGAQCLYALGLSTFDRYFIKATKILFDAGAINRTLSLDDQDGETPWDFVGGEICYHDTCEINHSVANVYEAVYQIYQAADEGRPYKGIDSYEVAVGKKILNVYATANGDKPIFYPLDLPNFNKENCYTATLYFVYDDGALLTTQYADFWTDTEIPYNNLVDVSECFDTIVGKTVKQFVFKHRDVVKGTTCYGQPITTLEMETGEKITFSINFGDVKEEERAAFFEIKI